MTKLYALSFFIFGFSIFTSCSQTTVKPHHDLGKAIESSVFPTEIAEYVKNWDSRKLAAPSVYTITGTCGGLPKVDVKTAPGFCVGQIDDGAGMVFPRTAVEINSTAIFVVDMGGWEANNGRFYILKSKNGKYERTTVLDKTKLTNKALLPVLDRPHLALKGPDDHIYIGAATAIGRFDPKIGLSSLEIVVQNIPAQGLHPLKAFTFDQSGNLYVNVGSATNVCEKQGVFYAKQTRCTEAESTDIGQALIRIYPKVGKSYSSTNYRVYARGLRNSMALLWHPKKNILIQGENSRDNVSKYDLKMTNLDFPHEEINIIKEGSHYGWPYCFDSNLNNPEWTHVDCQGYAKPYMLLPAHSSPLSMIMYNGSQFPSWYQNRILASLHGYEPRGHRIVAYLRDDNGLPTGKPLSVVYGWDSKGQQLMGSPVGLSQTADGGVLIVEDKSKKVLKLFFDTNQRTDGKPILEIPDVIIQTEEEKNKIFNLKKKLDLALNRSVPPLFAQIQSKMIDKHCAQCHSGADARGLSLDLYDYEDNEKRIINKRKAQEILNRLKGGTEFAVMPPDGFTNLNEKNEMIILFQKWIDSLK